MSVVLKEKELEDDYPVFWDYLYVCDGIVISSDVQGTVKHLKADLREFCGLEANVITNCDILGRQQLKALQLFKENENAES